MILFNIISYTVSEIGPKSTLIILTPLLYILTKIKSEKSTFVFKSPENKNHADKNYYQINM